MIVLKRPNPSFPKTLLRKASKPKNHGRREAMCFPLPPHSFLLPSSFPPSANASFEALILLEFSLALSAFLETLYLLSLSSTQLLSIIYYLHHVFRRIWIGSRVEFFSKLDLCSSTRFHMTRASPTCSPSSSTSIDTSHNLSGHPHTRAWLARTSE
jgi:hypothetical protein